MDGIDAGVFKSYDIRGTYPDQLDGRFAYVLGRVLPRVLEARRVALGRDARVHSPVLYRALTAGLEDSGARTAGLGLCPTELVYFVTGRSGATPNEKRPGESFDLGVMITASHNPPEYNGFKIVRAGGRPVSAGTGLSEVHRAMGAARPPGTVPQKEPSETIDSLESYLEFALELAGQPSVEGLRVAVDPGNGVAGMCWELLEERLGLRADRLNFEPDGRFPAHHPDPSKRQNLGQLTQALREGPAEMGFAFDGDADRVVVVLDDGHLVDGSEMTLCIADRLMATDPELSFGVAQTTSRKALDYYAEQGLEPMIVPVGHAKIKAAMRCSPRMRFAGEDAGHYYYRDFFCCDSSLLTTLHLLHLAGSGRLRPLVQSLPGPWRRPVREPSFHFPRREKALAVCRSVARRAVDQNPGWVEITVEREGEVLRHCGPEELACSEGTRVDYADWWFCVRPSGTEPIARLALEARTRALLREKTEMLSSFFDG